MYSKAKIVCGTFVSILCLYECRILSRLNINSILFTVMYHVHVSRLKKSDPNRARPRELLSQRHVSTTYNCIARPYKYPLIQNPSVSASHCLYNNYGTNLIETRHKLGCNSKRSYMMSAHYRSSQIDLYISQSNCRLENRLVSTRGDNPYTHSRQRSGLNVRNSF